MDRKTRRDVVATLIKAGRRDLARIVVGDSIDKAFGRHPKGQKARKLIEQLGGTVDDHFTTFGEDQVYVGIAKFNSEQQATQFQAANSESIGNGGATRVSQVLAPTDLAFAGSIGASCARPQLRCLTLPPQRPLRRGPPVVAGATLLTVTGAVPASPALLGQAPGGYGGP
jgi:hypothetical protein